MRIVYDSKTKAAFVGVARSARKAGKSWQQAFEAAQAAGYNGSMPGIKKMVLYDAPANGRRRGRRGKNFSTRAAGRQSNHDLDSLEVLIQNMVQQRCSAAIESAIAALQHFQV